MSEIVFTGSHEERDARMRALGVEPPPPMPITAEEMRDNQFLGQTGRVPRPTKDEGLYRLHRDDTLLKRDQKRWDDARKLQAHNDKLSADRAARHQAERDAELKRQDDAETARRAAARAQLEVRLKQQFMANPAATETDWERSKDAVIARHLEDEAVAISADARRTAAATYTG